MSQQICFIAFGTFGNPNGFKQTFFIGGNAEIAKNIKTFDLKTDAIQLFPASKIYALRKELINGCKALSYSLYTYAKEQNSDRGGTFIGSSILYLNYIAEETHTVNCLNEFHEKLVGKNVRNDVILVTHSDQFIVSKPNQYDKLTSPVKDIEDLNFNQSTHKNLVVYVDVSAAKLPYWFAQAMPLLDVYDVVYFTSSKEVAQFVHQKNLFQLVQTEGFEQELAKLQEERKQHILLLVTEYENEKQKLEEDKQKILTKLKEQIDANEAMHLANKKCLDESKQELNNIIRTYEGYEKKIEDAIHQLTAGKKPHLVKQLLNENKAVFIESINEQKKPAFVSTISKPTVKTDMKISFQPDISQPDSVGSNYRHRRHNRHRKNAFKIISFVLLFLWLATILYFLFFTKKEDVLLQSPKQEVQAPPILPSVVPKAAIAELNPKPNAKLTGAALRTVLTTITAHAPADSVVKVIFDNNLGEIKNVYANQVEAYTRYLVEQNKNCFEKKDSTLYLKNATLVIIPSYKKP